MEGSVYYLFNKVVLLPHEFGLPVNIWILMLPLAALPLILLVGVHRSARMHFLRIIGAVVLTYILLLLAAHSERILEWLQRRAFLEQHGFPNPYSEAAQACGHDLDVEDVVKIALVVLFGPLIAAAYVGLWEGVWRLWNRTKIKQLGDAFEGRYFSNAIIVAPVVLLCLVVVLVVLSRA